jgi:hypothetical protein
VVCGVCAREMNRKSEHVVEVKLEDLPHSERLVPQNQHEAHDLYEGRLLEPRGVKVDEGTGRTNVNVCKSCFNELKQDSTKPPRYSLANDLWIGRVPQELEVLTFPEQLLISHLYPRCYVFKLFPKHFGPRDASTLQRGMRGTVSTYDFDMAGISSMIEGNLMPRRPNILASIVSVAFVGLGDLPMQWLRNTFRVRRKYVYKALCWLKEHNPKYYGDITISMDHLAMLPEDDVPLEILGITCDSTDTEVVEREHEGYVPLQGGDEMESESKCDHVLS